MPSSSQVCNNKRVVIQKGLQNGRYPFLIEANIQHTRKQSKEQELEQSKNKFRSQNKNGKNIKEGKYNRVDSSFPKGCCSTTKTELKM